jgi:hypothetical protein
MSGRHDLVIPLSRGIRITLLGAGGNGEAVLSGLARLNLALRARGNPFSLEVVTYDSDRVTVANIGRGYFQADVGQYKCILLTHRINMCYGFSWMLAQRLVGT